MNTQEIIQTVEALSHDKLAIASLLGRATELEEALGAKDLRIKELEGRDARMNLVLARVIQLEAEGSAKDLEIEALRSEMAMKCGDYKMHEHWETASADKLRKTLRFQGAMTHALIPYQNEALLGRNEIAAKDLRIKELESTLRLQRQVHAALRPEFERHTKLQVLREVLGLATDFGEVLNVIDPWHVREAIKELENE